MPSNTDNSGSARAARLRRISAARGPVPVIRPNIGSMALDAILGREPACCPSPSEPPAPTLVLITCGISLQTLDPSIEYIFRNNTGANVDVALTDNSGNPPLNYSVEPFAEVGPVSSLVSWQTNLSFSLCARDQDLIVYSSATDGCFNQILKPFYNCTFYAADEPPPITIIIRDASNVDTTVLIPDTDPVGPFTNLISWRPVGCAPPS